MNARSKIAEILVGLLATAFTMEDDFYSGRLRDRHGLRVLTPPAEDRRELHRVIFEELCVGRVEPASRRGLEAMIAGK